MRKHLIFFFDVDTGIGPTNTRHDFYDLARYTLLLALHTYGSRNGTGSGQNVLVLLLDGGSKGISDDLNSI